MSPQTHRFQQDGIGLPHVKSLFGEPPALPVQSGSNSFALMLTRLNPPADPVVLERCSFAVTLTTRSKTTNGEYFGYPEASETAAFALAIDGSD